MARDLLRSVQCQFTDKEYNSASVYQSIGLATGYWQNAYAGFKTHEMYVVD